MKAWKPINLTLSEELEEYIRRSFIRGGNRSLYMSDIREFIANEQNDIVYRSIEKESSRVIREDGDVLIRVLDLEDQ